MARFAAPYYLCIMKKELYILVAAVLGWFTYLTVRVVYALTENTNW